MRRANEEVRGEGGEQRGRDSWEERSGGEQRRERERWEDDGKSPESGV